MTNLGYFPGYFIIMFEFDLVLTFMKLREFVVWIYSNSRIVHTDVHNTKSSVNVRSDEAKRWPTNHHSPINSFRSSPPVNLSNLIHSFIHSLRHWPTLIFGWFAFFSVLFGPHHIRKCFVMIYGLSYVIDDLSFDSFHVRSVNQSRQMYLNLAQSFQVFDIYWIE
jgi:hypothetical protein